MEATGQSGGGGVDEFPGNKTWPLEKVRPLVSPEQREN